MHSPVGQDPSGVDSVEPVEPTTPLSRRSVLKGIAIAGRRRRDRELLVVVEDERPTRLDRARRAPTRRRRCRLRRRFRRCCASPGSRPNPTLPEGTDTMPKIEHIVVVMMENHSFDDRFGMLGRGDGFKLDSSGRPLDANPMADGRLRARVPHAVDVPARRRARAELGREPHLVQQRPQRRFRARERPGRDGLLGRDRHSLLLRARARRFRVLRPLLLLGRSRRRIRTGASSSRAPRRAS